MGDGWFTVVDCRKSPGYGVNPPNRLITAAAFLYSHITHSTHYFRHDRPIYSRYAPVSTL